MPDGTVTRFRWERALIQRGPASATTRLVLLVLATHLNKSGEAWPSQMTLAQETGLSGRAIVAHLEDAEIAGWIRRTTSWAQGKAWRRHTYRIRIPDGAARRSPPKEGEGAAPRSAASAHESSTDRPPEAGAEPHTEGAAPHAQGAYPDDRKVLNDVQLNIEVISTKNISKNTTTAEERLSELVSEHDKVKGNGNPKGVYSGVPQDSDCHPEVEERSRRIAELVAAGRTDEARALSGGKR